MHFQQWLIDYELLIRMGAFLGIFAVVGTLEHIRPRRALRLSKISRWTSNLGLVALNTLLLRLLVPFTVVSASAFVVANGWGVLNYWRVPFYLALPATLIAMDFVVWLQHVVTHHVPLFWRLHRVHHTDLDYDLTTGSRFHPIEIGLSMLVKIAAIAVLGPPVAAVVVFEVVLSTAAMFNHGNLHLPTRLDRVLRWFIVTPDMHRVHHSVEMDETNSNFGFNLPWWDRLFGTYRAEPRAGQTGMTIGVNGSTDVLSVVRLDGLLLLPFKGP